MKTRNKVFGRIGKVVAFKCAVIRLLGKFHLLNAQTTRALVDYVLVEGSDLFCADWYLQANPDVARAKCDPVWHFCNVGGKEGRAPSPAFDGNDYLKRYPDVQKKGMVPLLHYLRHGAKEHRRFRPIPTALSAFEWLKGYVLRSGLFDAKWCGMSVSDYLRTGWVRGIDPSRRFSTAGYFALNPDVAKAKICPLVHYLLYGQYEGRSWDIDDQAIKRLVAEADERHGQMSLQADFPFPHSAVPVFWKRSPRRGKHGRLAVFAAYSKDGTIPDTTLYYLRGLRRVVDDIVFVSDNPVLPSEVDKIKKLVCCAWCERHEEYDFGSYKRGWRYVMGTPKLRGCSEIVFCNDSCYGPVTPFDDIFLTMSKRNVDFWGMVGSRELQWHLQSYFWVLTRKVFMSGAFMKFIQSVCREKSVRDVVLKYEVPFTQQMIDAGFSAASYVFLNVGENEPPRLYRENPTAAPIYCLEQGSPLVKVKAIKCLDTNNDGVGRTIDAVTARNPMLGAMLECFRPQYGNITFSVILPTYNRAYCIDRAIDAILNQTYQKFELIIIDDGSTDGTEEHVRKKYGEFIKSGVIKYSWGKNAGVCKSRNRGLSCASGDWIAYVDSDNMPVPTFLELVAQTIVRNPGHKTFYGRLKFMSTKKQVGSPFSFDALLEANYIDLGTFVHSRSIVGELGGFDESMTRLVDWDLVIRYTEKYPPAYIGQILLIYNDTDSPDRISKSVDYVSNLHHLRSKRRKDIVVTTVVTSYNHEKYIEKAIESAIWQKENGVTHEILLSDDGSTDGTRDIIRRYARKYPFIRDISSDENLGISANLRKCFAAASGKYVAILEGDDYWMWDSKISRQVAFLEANPDCSMVFSRIKLLHQKTGKFSSFQRQERLPTKLTGEDFLKDPYQNPIANFSCCMFVTEIARHFPKILYSVRFNEIACAFYIVQKGAIGFLPIPMTAYRLHDHGVWSSGDKEKNLRSAIESREVALKVCASRYSERMSGIIDELKAQLRALQGTEGK